MVPNPSTDWFLYKGFIRVEGSRSNGNGILVDSSSPNHCPQMSHTREDTKELDGQIKVRDSHALCAQIGFLLIDQKVS